MTTATADAPASDAANSGGLSGPRRIVFLGNPNVGKTTLFNRLCGVRHKTSNFPGTTQEARLGRPKRAPGVLLIDLPGVYSLHLNQPESELVRGVLEGTVATVGDRACVPDEVIVVLDATSMPRSLRLLGEVLRLGRPTAVVVNLLDAARRRGLHLDLASLERRLGVPVFGTSGRTGEGVERIAGLGLGCRVPEELPPEGSTATIAWADSVYAEAAADHEHAEDKLTDRLDLAFTHPVLGLVSFAAIVTALFIVIFKLASYPMDMIDGAFGSLAGWVSGVLPTGLINEMLTDGVIAGVGATLVFLPQIVLLFFLISLLEDSGYLARAAFVMDRVMRPFGLSGHAFVPLLSSHACALPGISACRGIPDRRDRLAAILSAPFMSCSARIPVYVLLTQALFPGQAVLQGLAFTGCYALGAVAGLLTSLLLRRTVLKGTSRAMAIELPAYRPPSFVNAVLTTWDRAWMFLRKAGTVILAISIALWWLGAFPKAGGAATPESDSLRAQAAEVQPDDAASAEALLAEAEAFDEAAAQQAQARESFLGRIGSTVQPVFAPMGADERLTIGILASFAAREVFVSTLAVQVAGSDDAEDEGVLEQVRGAERADGSRLLDLPTSVAMLVFFVLAMQCLPTLAVTAKEAGGWKWAGLQFAWMSAVAYVAAVIAYQVVRVVTA